jgi:hypothetical protein
MLRGWSHDKDGGLMIVAVITPPSGDNDFAVGPQYLEVAAPTGPPLRRVAHLLHETLSLSVGSVN